MEYEDGIRSDKASIARHENQRIEYEQALGGKGESSIIRYY